MKVSPSLTELFTGYSFKLMEDFAKSFSLDLFILHVSQTGSVHFLQPNNVENQDEGYYVYDGVSDFICAIYGKHTEEEIAEKFRRFLKIRIFL